MAQKLFQFLLADHVNLNQQNLDKVFWILETEHRRDFEGQSFVLNFSRRRSFVIEFCFVEFELTKQEDGGHTLPN